MPLADIALAFAVITCRHYGAVAFKTYGVQLSRRYGHDIIPFINIALPILIIACGGNSTVCPQSDCMD